MPSGVPKAGHRDRREELPVRHDRDTGCDWYPRCLSCPLPQCRYDVADAWLVERERRSA